MTQSIYINETETETNKTSYQSIKGVVLYTPFASGRLTGHCWEVILLVWTCYGGCWHCGEVAVVKKKDPTGS